LERTVRNSEPPVLEDREWRERNRLLNEEQKQKKDATMRKRDEVIHSRRDRRGPREAPSVASA
jgi:hypothetical protein